MFDSLTQRLSKDMKKLRGLGRLSEKNIKDTLHDVRMALLEADVALPVVKEFVEKVRQQAVGQEVIASLTPGYALIKVVRNELTQLMGERCEELNLNAPAPLVVLMAGLQGSGKTTTIAKLSHWLMERKKKSVMVVSCDIYRPAAIKQLETLATEVGAQFFPSDTSQKPVDIATAALSHARKLFADVLLIDTAGRLHIDEEMMTEIKALHAATEPTETLFVADSMTGQDAANAAKAFDEALPLTGVILTKTDCDARGGAALSVRQITGKPIKFIGLGEKTNALEPFYPDRIASRIIGQGDALTLIEEAACSIDREHAEKVVGKRKKGIPKSYFRAKSPSHFRSAPNQGVPVTSQTQPLPHHGLFIRRNSAFGTKLSTSLKDIIAQGVRVEQQHIRFDDFVAMKTEGIPSPTAHHALAVSHGTAGIPAYQQRNNRATHYLEMALKTADAASAGHLETQAPPVNYIFVVDVSGSMSGEKIDTVKAAIRELFLLLRADDVIGVIAFDNQVKTLLESTPKQNLSADDFGQIINRLTVGGMTDINLALSISIDEMRRYRGAQRVNQLFLFSDGDPTAGETNWINIRQNIATKLRKNTATDGNIRLSTFVFGTDANKVELDKLAGITGGQSTLVIEPAEDVRDSLQQELNRRTHLAAINVQMQIEIDPDIEIMHFYGHTLITDRTVRAAVEREANLTGKQVEKDYGVKAQPDLIKEDQGIRVFVPNLAKGETYWVVFELAVPAHRQSTDFGTATVQYFDTFARQNEKHPFDLATTGPITPQWVAQHALGLWTSELASYALYDVEAQDLATAEKRIQAHISILEAARSHLTSTLDASSAALIDDIITLNKFLSLAENLNKETTGGTEASNYLNYGLSELDRVRNGFVCRECA